MSKSEIEQDHSTFSIITGLDKHVFRREVAMNDACCMNRIEPGEHLVDDVDSAVDGQRSVLTNDRAKGASLVQFHQDKRSSIGQTTVTQDRSDIRMLDSGRERDLPKEATDNAFIHCITGLNCFQRQAFARFDIVYGVHNAHSPTSHDPIENEMRQLRLREFLMLDSDDP